MSDKAKIRTYRDLNVWKKAISLAVEVYRKCSKFPQVEMYGLVSQMQKASVSISANIAEGYARRTRKEYLRFLDIALGSLYELQTQTVISTRLNYLKNDEAKEFYELQREIERMLTAMMTKLRQGAAN